MRKCRIRSFLLLCLLAVFGLTACSGTKELKKIASEAAAGAVSELLSETKNGAAPQAQTVLEVPEYDGTPYAVIHDNEPEFPDSDKNGESFETYAPLDALGRCQTAYANIGQDLMPTEKRGNISEVKPSGWHSVRYEFVDGKSLYNRCHLIGYQLTAENANKQNLITGTRYMNVDGMLPFENLVADYLKETNNHVLYRVTPIYDGDNLVAKGVQMEAYSVEDEGDGVCYNVFVYNVQPGVVIDYATGESREDGAYAPESKKETPKAETAQGEIRGNKHSQIYHCPGQSAYEQMADSPNLIVFSSEKEAQAAGYRKAKR